MVGSIVRRGLLSISSSGSGVVRDVRDVFWVVGVCCFAVWVIPILKGVSCVGMLMQK